MMTPSPNAGCSTSSPNLNPIIWAFEGDGRWQEYVGGYADWLRQRPTQIDTPVAKRSKNSTSTPARPRRASFKDKHELSVLPARIERLETARYDLFARMSAPEFYSQGKAEIARVQSALAAAEHELEAAMARWVELEELVNGGSGAN